MRADCACISSVKKASWLRPSCLARYMAISAWRARASKLLPSVGNMAMPTETLTLRLLPRTWQVASSCCCTPSARCAASWALA
ncbi:hypothetical protein D3C78_1432230 [compost metagenome]